MVDKERDVFIDDGAKFKRELSYGEHIAIDKGVYVTVDCKMVATHTSVLMLLSLEE